MTAVWLTLRCAGWSAPIRSPPLTTSSTREADDADWQETSARAGETKGSKKRGLNGEGHCGKSSVFYREMGHWTDDLDDGGGIQAFGRPIGNNERLMTLGHGGGGAASELSLEVRGQNSTFTSPVIYTLALFTLETQWVQCAVGLAAAAWPRLRASDCWMLLPITC